MESRENFFNFYGAVPKRRSDGPKAKPARFSPSEVNGFLTKKASISSKFVVSIGITADSDVAYAAFNDGRTTEVGHRWDIPHGELHQMAEDIRSKARSFSQIRISATPRGKALAEMLRERKLGAKVKLVDMPTGSSNLNLFLDQVQDGRLRVWDGDAKQETRMALTTFWLEINPRSGGVVAVSTLKSHETLMLALANSAVDDARAARLRSQARYSPEAGDVLPEANKQRRQYSW